MGRPRKNPVDEVDAINEEIESAPVDADSGVKEPPEAPAEVKTVSKGTVNTGPTYSVTASFKTRTMEGDRITHKYKGVGKSVAEALESVVGSDEELADEYNKPFPKGINILVNVVIRTSAGHEFSRAPAPHVVRQILENKDVARANQLFGL